MALMPTAIHPMLVHFPLALLPTAALFATYAVWKREAWAWKSAIALLALGSIAGLAAVATGLYDHLAYESLSGTRVWTEIEVHEYLALAAEGLHLALLAWWWRARASLATDVRRQRLFVALLWLGTVLLVATGYVGGRLVFEHGLGVSSEGAGLDVAR